MNNNGLAAFNVLIHSYTQHCGKTVVCTWQPMVDRFLPLSFLWTPRNALLHVLGANV
jgi:hypothetical protein